MKKILLSIAFIFACMTAANADGSAFTPLNFNDTSYNGSKAPTQTYAAPTVPTSSEEAIGNGNIQNAIAQLENAQIDIRNDLLNCKTKFADVDAQYKLVKAERAALKKQIRSIEKRINEIDRAKEKIRSNML